MSKTPDMVTKEASNLLNNSDSNDILKNIRLSDANRLIIAQLNINSLLISGRIDILVESKLDYTFPTNQQKSHNNPGEF